jgi:hypothetical protein
MCLSKVGCAFLLQEIHRNIPAAKIRKWNVLDALHIVAM